MIKKMVPGKGLILTKRSKVNYFEKWGQEGSRSVAIGKSTALSVLLNKHRFITGLARRYLRTHRLLLIPIGFAFYHDAR